MLYLHIPQFLYWTWLSMIWKSSNVTLLGVGG